MRIKGLPIVRSGLLVPRRAEDDVPADDGTLGTMFVRFSPVDTRYEINSFWEGRFIEETKSGAFKKTISESKRSDGRFSTKVLFQHGMDSVTGDRMLGVPNRFAEVDTPDYRGPELEVPLYDTSYNRDLVPGLRDGAYGSSFMFEVIREQWDNEPEPDDTNPEGLPVRSLQEVRVFEAGPVTWPASPTASAGLRSLAGTDQWMERVAARDTGRHGDLVRSFQAFRAMYNTPDYRQATPTPEPQADSRRQVEQDMAQRDQSLRQIRLAQMRRVRV